jgi:hypothetical protein
MLKIKMNRKTKPTTGQGQEKFQEMKIIFIFFISGGLSVLVMQRYIESLGIVNRVIVNVL